MKIIFTGGPGGHFFPIIAVAEQINKIIKEEKLLPAKLYFMSDSVYDSKALATENITFVNNPAGKLRLYFSFLNIIDLFKTGWGVIISIFKLFVIFPDVVFSKGAYSSFPVVIAARILGIPVIVHESDSVPGRTNLWTGKFANRIALSYPEAAQYFDPKIVAVTGNPLRRDILNKTTNGAFEYLKLEQNVPVILILGGSQGAAIINNAIMEALPRLVKKYQIIHQVGKRNIKEIINLSKVVLGENNEFASRYKPYDFLNNLTMSMAAGVATVVISRAGSTIFEIANWGIPSIIIPITDSNGDHQRRNAYAYGHEGACTVIEENNLSDTILELEIDRLINNPAELERMSKAAQAFAKPDAAEKVAREILRIALSHEK